MSRLDLIIHQNADEFNQAVQQKLEEVEAENSLLLGLLERLKASPPATLAFMAEVRLRDESLGAAFYQERNLIISRGPEEGWGLIARKLKERGTDIPSVVGPAEDAEAMAKAWCQVRGCTFELVMSQRIYRLTEVEWPRVIPGKVRLAGPQDYDFLYFMIEGFCRDAIPWETHSPESIAQITHARIFDGTAYFWEVDGKPVTLTCLSRPTRRGITINYVYTPPEHRKMGYASALVAAVSAEGLEQGKEFCVLYTDLSNPTSNSIYQKVGYRPVCYSRVYRFQYLP